MIGYDRKMECKTPSYTVSHVLLDHLSWINNHSKADSAGNGTIMYGFMHKLYNYKFPITWKEKPYISRIHNLHRFYHTCTYLNTMTQNLICAVVVGWGWLVYQVLNWSHNFLHLWSSSKILLKRWLYKIITWQNRFLLKCCLWSHAHISLCPIWIWILWQIPEGQKVTA